MCYRYALVVVLLVTTYQKSERGATTAEASATRAPKPPSTLSRRRQAPSSSLCGFQRAVVTGANGYLGSEIVRQLLLKGCQVTGVLRSPKALHEIHQGLINNLDGSTTTSGSEFLPLHLPDLCRIDPSDTSPTSPLSLAMAEADVVFHPAGPMLRSFNDVERDLVVPWIESTRKIVQAAAATRRAYGRPHRVILTSSTAALRGPQDVPSEGGPFFTGKDWNRSSRRDGPGMEPYQFAKAEAEREAWRIIYEPGQSHGLELVSILPSFLLGPPSTTKPSFNVDFVGSWLQGRPVYESRLFVDVRDVALAHIRAAEVPSAAGHRYIASHPMRTSPSQVAEALESGVGVRVELNEEMLKKAFPADRVEVDPSSLSDLGITLRPMHETIADTAKWLLDEASSS